MPSVDFAQARLSMVEGQLKPNRIAEPRLLAAFGSLPRELFLPPDMRGVAYVDRDLTAGGGAVLAPLTLARLIQAAAPQPGDSALLIGAASGYEAAALARMCGFVVALCADEATAVRVQTILAGLDIDNAIVVHGDLTEGWAEHAPFAAIVLNGAAAALPPALAGQLGEGGRIAYVAQGRGPIGRLRLGEKRAGTLSERDIADAAAPFVPGFAPKPEFVL